MDNLFQMLQDDRRLMKAASSELKKRGETYARAEAEYQATKNKRALELKADGFSATMIQLIIKGDDEVNDKLFERDLAEMDYRSAIEALNVYKLDARMIEAQIQREWTTNEY